MNGVIMVNSSAGGHFVQWSGTMCNFGRGHYGDHSCNFLFI